MLAAIRTSQDALKVLGIAEAARVYARQVKLGTQAENHATAIKLKAEIRLAQLVDEGQERGEVAERGRPEKTRAASVSTLDELGIDSGRLSEARAIATTFTPADIDEIVDAANSEDRSISRRALVVAARTARPQPERTPAKRLSDRLRQQRHRRTERVRPTRIVPLAEWDARAIGERALFHCSRLRNVIRRHHRFAGDLDAVEESIRQLAWGPE